PRQRVWRDALPRRRSRVDGELGPVAIGIATMSSAPWSERRATAVHEAGHAAMALTAGRVVEYVQMRAEEHGEMKCDLGMDVVMDLAIGLAGPAAERCYSDRYADLPKRYRQSFRYWCAFHDEAVHNLALQSS